MGIVSKIFGGLIFFGGLLIVVGYPYWDIYQSPVGMTKGAILFGLILMGIGVYLMMV